MRVGLRKSALAERQTVLALGEASVENFELCYVLSSGDKRQQLPDEVRVRIKDKRMWIDGLQDAIVAGDIDCAVHSAKDVPAEPHPETTLQPLGARHWPGDALVLSAALSSEVTDGLGKGRIFSAVPPGSVMGTASVRRSAQLRYARPDLTVVPLTGNLDTRMRKLDDPALGYSAAVLAEAGLNRMDYASRISEILDPNVFCPAMNQGIVVVEFLRSRRDLGDYFAAQADPSVVCCWECERSFVRRLGADCHSAVGVWARLIGGTLRCSAQVLAPDGTECIAGVIEGPAANSSALGTALASDLLERGAQRLLSTERC